MHDPLVVAFEIRRPWPERTNFYDAKPGKPRFRWSAPFFSAFGRGYWFPSFITVWHVEPGGRDSGEVCKHRVNGKITRRWRWHVWHWRIQIHPVLVLKRFLFERCIECGRRFPWGYSPVSHQWDGPRSRWFRINRLAYHNECSGLVSARQDNDLRGRLIRYLFNALRVETDESEEELLQRLTDPKARTLEFIDAYRLQGLFGYERDDECRLVKRDVARALSGRA